MPRTIKEVDLFDNSKDYLVEARIGLPKLTPKVRSCLRCGKHFMSEHAGHRRCDECTHNMITMSMCGVQDVELNVIRKGGKKGYNE